MSTATPPPPRSDAAKDTSRRGLACYVVFAAAVAVVAVPQLIVNRVESTEVLAGTVEKVCGSQKGAVRTVLNSMHVSYTVSIPDPQRYLPDLGSVVSNGVVIPGIDVTRDLQAVYYTANPGSARSYAREAFTEDSPLHWEVGLVVHIVGTPVEADFALPRCSYEKSEGGICVIDGSGEGGSVALDLRESEARFATLLQRELGPLGGTDEAVVAACETLGSLVETLSAVQRLPLHGVVYAQIERSIGHLVAVEEELSGGKDEGMRRSRAFAALQEARLAFASPHLITSTYFPPTHLFAVYLPLFFPIVATCLIGVVWELKTSKAERGKA